MTQINFKANFIKSVDIQKEETTSKYIPHTVSMLEVDPHNDKDLYALEDVKKFWKKNLFCNEIAYLAENCNNKDKVYIISEQKENFKNLDPSKIIGLMSTYYTDKSSKIYYLEAKSDNKYNHIGSILVEHLQDNTKQINAFCPRRTTLPFYYKLGFIQDNPNSKEILEYGKIHWTKPESKNIEICKKENLLKKIAKGVKKIFFKTYNK